MTANLKLRRESHAQERLSNLLPQFAANAAKCDSTDEFVADNYAALKQARLMSIAVPQELGGDGLNHAEISVLLRNLARACSSTALALSMHTHVTAFLTWRWRNQKAPVDAVLKRVAAEQIVILTSGGSDWLDSSGSARKVDGGFVIDAVKGFSSGAEAGALLNTGAIYDDPEAGPTVVHFMAPMTAKEVTIERNWRAMGMRATGSHQVRIAGLFVPDASIAMKRPRGVWHPLFHMLGMLVFSIIYSAYFGAAEAMRDAAIETAKRRKPTPQLVDAVGAMETELAAARVALDDMIAAADGQPGPDTTNRVFTSKSNLTRALLATADKALEVAQGSGYLRNGPIERLFRDIQGARYHPLTPHAQRDIAGRIALGLPLDGPLAA